MSDKRSIFQHPNRQLWLIFACLLLLGLSQILWIKKVWHEQENILQQECNFIFQKTVLNLQDSLVLRSMKKSGIPVQEESPLHGAFFDGANGVEPSGNMRWERRLRLNKSQAVDMGDSGSVQVKVIVADNGRQPVAVQRGLGRFLLNMRNDSLDQISKDIVFEFQSDTISSEELRNNYNQALSQASLPTAFVLLMNTDPAGFPRARTLATDPVPAGLLQHHFTQAQFQNYHGYLIQKVLPHALFSLSLFGLISLAFWLIFNTLKRQQKLSQQKSEFISNVSHELKTPLTTVGVALEALNDFEVLQNYEKTKEYLNISKQEIDRLNLLVDKILRLSMFEQQALKLQLETLDFRSVVKQVINAMTLQAETVAATIQFDNKLGAAWVFGDRLHLTGVVYNLLDNALKYRQGAPHIDISLEGYKRAGQDFIKLMVKDNGLGISPEYQQQVFEKFFRVPVGDTHNVKGHGLGLSYVAHVLQLHHGTIQVQSSPGQGSSFIVEIPAVASPPNP